LARSGRALAEARPVVRDRHAGRIALDENQMAASFRVNRHHLNDVREESAGRVEFLPIDDHIIALDHEGRAEGGDIGGMLFGKCVAEPITGQHLAEQERLLRLGAIGLDMRHGRQMVLRDLGDARIGGSDDFDHFGERHIGDAGPTVGFRHVDAPQPALRIGIHLGKRQQPLAIAQSRAFREIAGQPHRDLDRFRIGFDHMRRAGRDRARRHGIGGIDARMLGMIDRGFGERTHRYNSLEVEELFRRFSG